MSGSVEYGRAVSSTVKWRRIWSISVELVLSRVKQYRVLSSRIELVSSIVEQCNGRSSSAEWSPVECSSVELVFVYKRSALNLGTIMVNTLYTMRGVAWFISNSNWLRNYALA